MRGEQNSQQTSESASAVTFGPNWARAGVLAGITAIGYLIGREMDPSRATIPVWALETVRILLVATPATCLAWLFSVRLRLDPVGLHYHSVCGKREMRWDEVDELYAGAVTTLLYGFIPVGTRYSFRMRTGIGTERRTERTVQIGTGRFTFTKTTAGVGARELRFGSRFSNAEAICGQLIDRTFAHLLGKITQRLKSGMDVTFGDIVFTEHGIKVQFLGMFPDLMKKPILWENLSSYSVRKGIFTLSYGDPSDTAKLPSVTRGIADIPNFQVMLALLRELKPTLVAR